MRSARLHAVLSISAAAIALIGYGFWYAAVEAKSALVADLENQIVAKTGTANRLASSRASLTEIADDEATIRSYFVPETGVVAFIDALQARGKVQGATVSVLSVSASDKATRPLLTFSLAVTGTFDAVMRTVGAIEYAPYDLTVAGLSVGQNGKSSWRADLNIVVGSATAAESRANTP